jgi:hypothetical protein
MPVQARAAWGMAWMAELMVVLIDWKTWMVAPRRSFTAASFAVLSRPAWMSWIICSRLASELSWAMVFGCVVGTAEPRPSRSCLDNIFSYVSTNSGSSRFRSL